MNLPAEAARGPLTGIRVLDLSRVLAGPTATQLLGDLGAEVIKIERPGSGDDTRAWGPPYLKDDAGRETSESAYYLCTNRNKRSVAVDLAKPEGADLIRRLATQCDILIQNFKVGGLAKYGLAHEQLKESLPRLIYCSITGFGQTGPYANRPGYDMLIQGMGGIMSVTGPPEGPPTKVAVGIADVMCGMYASVAILSALRHRDLEGEGQHIDIALFDSQVAWLINEALNYFTSGRDPRRFGNAHANVTPYQVFASADGYAILACGNDGQFQRFCKFAGLTELADDPRYRTNADRIRNRDDLIPVLDAAFLTRTTDEWVMGLEGVNVPCGPVNDFDLVFSDPQSVHRETSITMPHPLAAGGDVRLLGNPIKMSKTPVTYRHPPPLLGQDTDAVLEELLDLGAESRAELRAKGVLGPQPEIPSHASAASAD